MKTPFHLFLLALSIVATGCATTSESGDDVSVAAEAARQLQAFPEAAAGYQRHVFYLPPLEEESFQQVSLILGKLMETDSVNHYFLSGSVEPVSVEGWGYTYYKLNTDEQMASTLMAPPPSEPKEKRFVEVNHGLGGIPYNSKLPMVVMVPEGFQVKYRIWSAGELHQVPQG